MKKTSLKKIIFFFCLFFSFHIHYAVQLVEAKVRIAYVEGGDYLDYTLILKATIDELARLNIINKGVPTQDLPLNYTAVDVWQAVQRQSHEDDLIEFVSDAFYSAQWDPDKEREKILSLKERIETQKDINLIFAFGTTAGFDVTQNIKNVNIMNFSTTDPVAANIVQSAENSGSLYVHAKIEPNRYFRQLALFHNIFEFDKLGICYENSSKGQGVISYDELVHAATELGFTIIEGKTPVTSSAEEALAYRIQCHQAIASQVDAMYLTFFGSDNGRSQMVRLLEPFIKEKVPTFSQSGSAEVALGALLSMSATNFNDMGAFHADVIRQFLEGTPLGMIRQIYDGNIDLALNLRMAVEIGWDLPFDLLAAVDEIYRSIENGK